MKICKIIFLGLAAFFLLSAELYADKKDEKAKYWNAIESFNSNYASGDKQDLLKYATTAYGSARKAFGQQSEEYFDAVYYMGLIHVKLWKKDAAEKYADEAC